MNKEKVRYLERLFLNEEERRKSIDTKLTTIVGQTGITFSISSLLLTFLYDKINRLGICYLIIIGILYIFITISFILSLILASQTFIIKKYNYMDGLPTTVDKYNTEKNGVDEILSEEINDLKLSIDHNVLLNNRKGSILLWAGIFFTTGISSISILIILLFFVVFTIHPRENEIKVSNQLNLEKIENKIDILNTHLGSYEIILNEVFPNIKNIKKDSAKVLTNNK